MKCVRETSYKQFFFLFVFYRSQLLCGKHISLFQVPFCAKATISTYTIGKMNSYDSLPDRKRALSTVNSSANLIWQKFFLLLRMAVISPHCPKTSMMSCSVAFSGRPPTNTVLHPGGRSLVAGGGRSVPK